MTKITMAHGSGGRETSDLINMVFAKHFKNPVLSRMEDSAVVEGSGHIALTTDSFVVTPLFFPGGDIGTLAVCGTVNDLAMSGATPKYLTCGFILETGASLDELEQIVLSMARMAEEAGVIIVAGDTKVIDGNGGVYINTSGVGLFRADLLPKESLSETEDATSQCNAGTEDYFPMQALTEKKRASIHSANCKAGDVVIVSGNLGDHHAAILSARMNITNTIKSDCAPLNHMTAELLASGVNIKAMRDITRGGLATVLNELAMASSCQIIIEEQFIPVSRQVQAFSGILGLDPLYMGNEGKLAVVVSEKDADRALACIKANPYGKDAAIIGVVSDKERNASISGVVSEHGAGCLLLKTRIGGIRSLPVLYGEGLPRIC